MKGRQQCAECGGALVKRSIAHTQAWGQRLYRFDHVPALVCVQCGQVWLAASVSQAIDRVIRKPPKPKKFLKVPVFSLSDLPRAR
ncbi:MAG TPA: YgiT-type zinc finger protein [Bryobacterales bacterium]|nr:YgiT-type zinc finger protein [Bryobacterales bacterium]